MTNNCMQKAIEYIDHNIMNDISLYDIACEAGFSVPQFYRLFKRLTGDTIGSYILRRKISLAAGEMKGTNKTISRIALDYGFESHDVFTRAFTRVYGVSPKKYRQSEGLSPLMRHSLEDIEQGRDVNQMQFHILDLPDFEVVGLECDALVWDTDGSIGRLWSGFLRRVEDINRSKSPMTMYGICEYEYCKKDHIRYMAAVGVNDIIELPKDMVRRSVRSQRFFQAMVPASISIPDAYAATTGYAKSLGYEIEDYDNIEVYDEIFKDPDFYSFQLLIPVKE